MGWSGTVHETGNQARNKVLGRTTEFAARNTTRHLLSRSIANFAAQNQVKGSRPDVALANRVANLRSSHRRDKLITCPSPPLSFLLLLLHRDNSLSSSEHQLRSCVKQQHSHRISFTRSFTRAIGSQQQLHLLLQNRLRHEDHFHTSRRWRNSCCCTGPQLSASVRRKSSLLAYFHSLINHRLHEHHHWHMSDICL